MTERVLGPTGGRRRKRLALFVPFLAIAALILAIGAAAGPVGNAAGFQDDDGNLDPAVGLPASGIDWNSFDDSSTWTGTAPKLERSTTVSGWKFLGLTDDQISTGDDSFDGGVKQDDDCAGVGGHKANNKEDLKRIYLASKTVSGSTYLMLSWVRIPQNSTSNSANIAFEFNRGTTACPAGSNGLVRRSGDTDPSATVDNSDMLIVYDFAGGGTPTIKLSRWIASGSAACDISNDSPPCWSPAIELVSLGFAEGKVNTAATAVDEVAPSNETLGLVEFGEAGIDLTAAGVFAPGTCQTFGKAYGVSRTSGNSAQAQMKDLVGPGNFTLTNCGEIKIIKRTDPRGIDRNFGFTSDINTSSTATCTADNSPAVFSLNDKSIAISGVSAADPAVVTTAVAHGFTSGQTVSISGSNSTPSIDGNRVVTSIDATHFSVPVAVTTAGSAGSIIGDSTRNTEDCTNVGAGTYNVDEDTLLPASGFGFKSMNCTATGSGTSVTPSGSQTSDDSPVITLAGGGLVTCIYTNEPLTGAIKVTKNAKNVNCSSQTPPDGCVSGKAPLAGAGFEIWQESNGCANLQTTATDCIAGGAQEPADTKVKNQQLTEIVGTGASAVATTCFSGLAFNAAATQYYVHESLTPSGYTGAADQTSVISSQSTCAGSPVLKSFENVPLSKITVDFVSYGAGNPTSATIQCTGMPGGNDASPLDLPEGTPRVLDNLPEGTYACTVVIDP